MQLSGIMTLPELCLSPVWWINNVWEIYCTQKVQFLIVGFKSGWINMNKLKNTSKQTILLTKETNNFFIPHENLLPVC